MTLREGDRVTTPDGPGVVVRHWDDAFIRGRRNPPIAGYVIELATGRRRIYLTNDLRKEAA